MSNIDLSWWTREFTNSLRPEPGANLAEKQYGHMLVKLRARWPTIGPRLAKHLARDRLRLEDCTRDVLRKASTWLNRVTPAFLTGVEGDLQTIADDTDAVVRASDPVQEICGQPVRFASTLPERSLQLFLLQGGPQAFAPGTELRKAVESWLTDLANDMKKSLDTPLKEPLIACLGHHESYGSGEAPDAGLRGLWRVTSKPWHVDDERLFMFEGYPIPQDGRMHPVPPSSYDVYSRVFDRCWRDCLSYLPITQITEVHRAQNDSLWSRYCILQAMLDPLGSSDTAICRLGTVQSWRTQCGHSFGQWVSKHRAEGVAREPRTDIFTRSNRAWLTHGLTPDNADAEILALTAGWALDELHASIHHKASTRKRRRAAPRGSRNLTGIQVTAYRVYMECNGNMAEAARQLGRDRKTVEQNVKAALKKLGKQAVDPKTLRLPRGARGEDAITEDRTRL